MAKVKRTGAVGADSTLVEKKKKEKDEEVYTVEEIIADRTRGRKREYLCKWEGYSSAENTWEPEKNIIDKGLITAYNARKRASRRPGSSSTEREQSSDENTAAMAAIAGSSESSTPVVEHMIESTNNDGISLSSFDDQIDLEMIMNNSFSSIPTEPINDNANNTVKTEPAQEMEEALPGVSAVLGAMTSRGSPIADNTKRARMDPLPSESVNPLLLSPSATATVSIPSSHDSGSQTGNQDIMVKFTFETTLNGKNYNGEGAIPMKPSQ